MDDLLLQRFKDGDAGAAIALRNQLRTLAARVLVAPQWGLKDSGIRAGLEREAAQVALDSGQDTVVALTEEALTHACAIGIRVLREREAPDQLEHPDALELARVGAQTASAGQIARVEAHLANCARCTGHMAALRSALKAATTAQQAPSRAVAPAPRPQRPAPRPKSARRKDGPSRPPKSKASSASKGGIPWLAILGALAVVGGIVWRMQPSAEQEVWARAALLPDELPPSARADLYSGPSKRAIARLRDGGCRESASTLHLQAKDSQDPFLHWYEGVAWVCAREGGKALDALDQSAALSEDQRPWGYDWWRAQALVLEGKDTEALALLDGLARSDHGRSQDAEMLAKRIRGQ